MRSGGPWKRWRVRPSRLAWLAVNVTLLLAPLGWPRLRGPLFGEDRLVETVTALCFLGAFAAGTALAWRIAPGRRPLVATAAGLGLIGFLDEVSFGARMFGWTMPAMPGGGEFDGAHDVVVLTWRHLDRVDPVVGAAIGVCVMLLAALSARRRFARWLWTVSRYLRGDRGATMFALFVAALTLAALLDLEIGPLHGLGPVEELLELNAALALVLSILASAPRGRTAVLPRNLQDRPDVKA